MNNFKAVVLVTTFMVTAISNLEAEKKKSDMKRNSFSWNNPPGEWTLQNLPSALIHSSFKSSTMGIEVGYYIYLPPNYKSPKNKNKKYPVVFHLHGGRPGLEKKSISLANFVHQATQKGEIEPTIYVFPNGGPMSWYNYPQKTNGMAEDVFVKELVPHIDSTYRTFGKRSKRGLEGFSQGGRGTTRIMFKYPGLFASVAPGGSGYEPEMRIRDNYGKESENIRFEVGNDTWSLAQKYALRTQAPRLRILLWVGSKGFNYEYNLKFSKYLDELKIEHEMLVVPGAPHSAQIIYQKNGLGLMKFHQNNFN